MPEVKRPGTASAAATIELVFSSLAILLYLLAFVNVLSLFTSGGGELLPGLINAIVIFLFLLVSLLGLCGGILLLSNKRGGVSLSIFWSICELLYFLFIIGFVILLSLAPNALPSLYPVINQFLVDFILIIIFSLLTAGIPGLLVLCLVTSKKSRAFYFIK